MRELMDDKLNEPIDVGVGGYLYMTCGKSRERSLAWACKRETLQLSLPGFTPLFLSPSSHSGGRRTAATEVSVLRC
jgi:hypothetical protein